MSTNYVVNVLGQKHQVKSQNMKKKKKFLVLTMMNRKIQLIMKKVI